MSKLLDLSDPGWLRIDGAALTVSGALENIIQEMESVLGDEVVCSLCANLGILSTGFFFIDPHLGYTSFFEERKNTTPKTYRTQYLWKHGDLQEAWSDLLHWAFVHVRAIQARVAAAEAEAAELDHFRTEDFFRHIPKDDGTGYCVSEMDRQIRSTYSFHYVTLGEMLLTMLAWRALLAAVTRGDGRSQIADLNVELDERYSDPFLTCNWNGIQLIASDQSGADEKPRDQLREAWHRICRPEACLRSEWEMLGIAATVSGLASVELHALLTFATAAGFIDGEFEFSSEAMNKAIQKGIPMFMKSLGVNTAPETIADALFALERYARFPLFPFYLWHALDRAPKCYLVVPVWTSQQYAVDVDDEQCRNCRHLGLALSALAPLRRIDWTLPKHLESSQSERCSDADPTIISNVIRLMARPLVEEHLYGSALRELRKRIDDKTEDETQKTIDRLRNGG